MSTYLPNIPQPDQTPAATATPIQVDFDQFQVVFSENHTPINNVNQGDHEGILLTLQANDPGVTQDLDVLYAKNASAATSGPQPQLFLQIPQFLANAIPNFPMQLTYNMVNTSGPTQYQSFLPGGYILYFGIDSGTTASNTPISDTITLSPVPSLILLAIAIPNTLTTLGTPTPFSVSTEIQANHFQFKIFSGSNGAGPPIAYSFTWMAIAKA